VPNDSSTGGYLAPTSALAPEDDAFDNIMQEFVVGVTALPTNLVRPRWQPVPPDQPEANVNWCAIGLIEEDPQSGRSMITHDGAASGGLGADTLQVNDEAEIMASFYGPNAGQFAKLFRDGIMLPQNREALTLQGYRLCHMPSAARLAAELVNQVTIRRFDVTFRVKRESITVWPIENIASLQVELITDRFTETGETGLP
jgi:hypothetical protein